MQKHTFLLKNFIEISQERNFVRVFTLVIIVLVYKTCVLSPIILSPSDVMGYHLKPIKSSVYHPLPPKNAEPRLDRSFSSLASSV